ncbi:spinster family MFS transporter [Caballeronia sp. S22]|uniref:spinster family MFS transporter n=1 Tax=Caballeronia sp. S22 TaxID=3137182 RepID=UPI003531251F
MRAETIEPGQDKYAGCREVSSTSAGRSWYAVSVLLVAYIFSIMDRQILTLLVGPIQQTLHVNDTLIGTLHGFTFAVFYALMGLPIARIIDRGDRRLIIAIGIALWSLATAAGGIATEYWHLLLARVGVAVGEAVLIPGAISLIADLFPAGRRGRPMSLFGASGSFGSGAGLIVGGLILGVFTAAPPVLPWLGALHPWQATLMVLGLPGLIVALMMLAVPEPRNARRDSGIRSSADDTNAQLREAVPVALVKRYITGNLRTLVSLMIGAGFFYACVYGWAAWVPTYFVREFGWKYPQIGAVLGVLLAVIGPLSAMFGGWLGGFWTRRGVPHGYLRVALTGSVGIAVSAAGMVSMPSANLALVFMALTTCFTGFMFAAGPLAVQEVAPSPMRGQFAALYTGFVNLLGAGCGPVAIGMLTDHLFRDPGAVGRSIGILCFSCGMIAALIFRFGFASYRNTLKNSADWQPESVASIGQAASKAGAPGR